MKTFRVGNNVIFTRKLRGVPPNTKARIFAISEWAYLLNVNGKTMCIPFKIAGRYLKVTEK